MAENIPDSADQSAGKGPSKKELNKLARKEGKKNPVAATNATESKDDTKPALYSCSFYKAAAPDLARLVEVYLGENGLVKYFILKSTNESSLHMPVLVSLNPDEYSVNGSISGDLNIARFLVRQSSSSLNASAASPWLSSQIDQWLDVYLLSSSANNIKTSLNLLVNNHLSNRTYLVGTTITLADIAIWYALKVSNFSVEYEALPHVSRWYEFLTSQLPSINPIPLSFPPSNKAAASIAGKTSAANKDSISSSKAVVANKNEEDSNSIGGTCPPLENAIEGEVCTRFPPEPSGYLHLGHCKAVLLNQYYAQRYKGKLLVRFDDTNPSKEKDEFEENILQDLATLNVIPDKVSHSSDHFKVCEDLARQMMRDGLAYMDNTAQEVMQAERMERIESKNRNNTLETNLQLFEELLQGSSVGQSYCLRAKIDMNSVNGTMRDPVLYRFNDTPHHRTGTKYKAYPTYDFVCPIVDSIEGVTHALRTTEYNDRFHRYVYIFHIISHSNATNIYTSTHLDKYRDEQYHWIQNALKLRHVYIFAFGKMNFIHTVLSKRKLTWFVERGLVESWFDPRFPTIQGCVRRGMNVDALKSFIIGQGASRRVITMEWDKFWSENKKVLEERCPRYMGVSSNHKVVMHLENVPDEITEHQVQIHPQKPEFGERVMLRNSKIYIDQDDASTYKVGEEVTLLRWGNVIISSIEVDSENKISIIKCKHDPAATNFSKTKKATWIAVTPNLIPCVLVEFDHLITKAKLGEDDKFEDYVNPNTRKESDALCDPGLGLIKAGDVIQLERKGFYRCDTPFDSSNNKPMVLFLIPDGKVAKK